MRARTALTDPGVNPGKVAKLDALHRAYCGYLQECITQMVQDRVHFVSLRELKAYFPKSSVLSVHILTQAQRHACTLLHTWVKTRYQQKLKKHIAETPGLTDHQQMELRCCGKYRVSKAGIFGKGTISQEMVDLYWGWVWDPEIGGNPPTVSDRTPMYMSEFTVTFGPAEEAKHFCWWLGFSGLERGHRIQIPLVRHPKITDVSKLSKSALARKLEGRWSFSFVEKKTDLLDFDGSVGKVGVDVGINVIAATSDGRLYGETFKPKFDRLYKKTRAVRSNRFRQDLKKDSKRLHRLERRLSGMTKTVVGEIANQLVKSFPLHTFVLEDLDLSGCPGQKRFAYRALQNNLERKVAVEKVNPAYTSQMCPSCGHTAKNNRHGIDFKCRSCGRKSHADAVGGLNVLRRSEDKQIQLDDDPSAVKDLLRTRYFAGRKSSVSSRCRKEPVQPGPKLTVRKSKRPRTRTASNQVTDVTGTQ